MEADQPAVCISLCHSFSVRTCKEMFYYAECTINNLTLPGFPAPQLLSLCLSLFHLSDSLLPPPTPPPSPLPLSALSLSWLKNKADMNTEHLVNIGGNLINPAQQPCVAVRCNKDFSLAIPSGLWRCCLLKGSGREGPLFVVDCFEPTAVFRDPWGRLLPPSLSSLPPPSC